MINTTGGVENYFRLVSLERSAENAGQIVCDKMGMTVTHEEDSSLYIMLTKVSGKYIQAILGAQV